MGEGGRRPRPRPDEGKAAVAAHNRVTAVSSPLISPLCGQLPPRGKPRLSKNVCSPLGPLCEGAPPAGGGGENCTAARNISGYGKVLSLRPFGAPPSQREAFKMQKGCRECGIPFCVLKECIAGAGIARPCPFALQENCPGKCVAAPSRRATNGRPYTCNRQEGVGGQGVAVRDIRRRNAVLSSASR